MGGRRWTPEEDGRLRELWSSKARTSAIAQRLGRTTATVKQRAHRLKLGARIDAGERIGIRKLIAIVTGTAMRGVNPYLARKWIAMGLPTITVRAEKQRARATTIDDFWEWAKDNRESLDFSRFEENALGAEPGWVKEKRKIDRENRRTVPRRNSKWTDEEIQRMKWMIAHGATYSELTRELRRPESAIVMKIHTMQTDRPKRSASRRWTEAETARMMELTAMGRSAEYCAAELDRSPGSINGKRRAIAMANDQTQKGRRANEQ